MDRPIPCFHEQAGVYYLWQQSTQAYYWWDQDAKQYRIWGHNSAQAPRAALPPAWPSPSSTPPNAHQGQHPATMLIHSPASVTINNYYYYGNQYNPQQPTPATGPFTAAQHGPFAPQPPAAVNYPDHKYFPDDADDEPEPAPLYAENDPLNEVPPDDDDPDLPEQQEEAPPVAAPTPAPVTAKPQPKPTPENHPVASTKRWSQHASKKGGKSEAGRRLYVLHEERRSFLGLHRRSRTLQVWN